MPDTENVVYWKDEVSRILKEGVGGSEEKELTHSWPQQVAGDELFRQPQASLWRRGYHSEQ